MIGVIDHTEQPFCFFLCVLCGAPMGGRGKNKITAEIAERAEMIGLNDHSEQTLFFSLRSLR